ncbi:UNKNOWN [Stylonychia lemnae]|uniref:Uncharacterized protein n=1 Tax=Stylonychia lemnae TaxID=5949 RepID=A0A078B1L6_STYLE|nr:UNKNOWN [Stylonychia lemnae]|eukprot:CDW87168.1 UNKNOWN [Stylonychia lemnae]
MPVIPIVSARNKVLPYFNDPNDEYMNAEIPRKMHRHKLAFHPDEVNSQDHTPIQLNRHSSSRRHRQNINPDSENHINFENRRMGQRLMKILHEESQLKKQTQQQHMQQTVYQDQIQKQQKNMRKKKWESIMVDNFKMLERIQQQRSTLSHFNKQDQDKNTMNRYASHDKLKEFRQELYQHERDLKQVIEENERQININNNDERNFNHRKKSISHQDLSQYKENFQRQQQLIDQQIEMNRHHRNYSQVKSELPQQLPYLQRQDFNKRAQFDFDHQRVTVDQMFLSTQEQKQQSLNGIEKKPRNAVLVDKAFNKDYYTKMVQVIGLPQKRKVLVRNQRVIPGQMSEYLVELSRTKLQFIHLFYPNRKFFITAVKVSNPHKYHFIELFRKQGDKLVRCLDNQIERIFGQLEFYDGKKLIFKDLEFLLNYNPDYESPQSKEVKKLQKIIFQNNPVSQKTAVQAKSEKTETDRKQGERFMFASSSQDDLQYENQKNQEYMMRQQKFIQDSKHVLRKLRANQSSIFNTVNQTKMNAISERSNDESGPNSKYNISARDFDSRRVSMAPEIDLEPEPPM